MLTGQYWVGQKVPLAFKLKIKTHFSFSQRTLLNSVFTVLFHYLLPFFRQLHNSIFPKLFIFLSKELLQVPFTVLRGMEIFSLREFCKDRNKWKSEGAMSGEYSGWIRTSQPRCNSFCLVIKETCSLALSWWKIMCFLWLIPDAFCRVLLLVGLLGNGTFGINHLVFWKELIIEDSLPIPSHTQRHLLWMKTSLWYGWWWFISLARWSLPFHIIVQYPLFISRHNLF